MSVFIVIAWFVFSFLFWRGLRRWAIEEDRIFDLTFYATVVAFASARFGYVVTHWEFFAGKSWLLIPAVWILPGLSWLSGIIGALGTLAFLSRGYKVRLGLVLDTLALSLPLSIIIAKVGSLFTQVEIGKPTSLIWAIRMGRNAVPRHPVQFYEMIAVLLVSILAVRLTSVSAARKWPYGMVGTWFFLVYAVLSFVLEFAKETRVYWGNLTANQWVLIGIFAESIGVLYIRGGGREWARPLWTRSALFLTRMRKGMYGFISRRHAEGNQKAS